MDESTKINEDTVSEPEVGSGALLSQERKKIGKTVEEIAEELNLSVSQIRSIERDQSEGLPEPTYVRGYIRSYAKLLGLDAEEVLNHYQNKNWQKSTSLDDIPRGISDAEESDTSVFSPLKVFIFLVLIGVAVYAWFASQGVVGNQNEPSADAQQPTSVVAQGLESATPDNEIEQETISDGDLESNESLSAPNDSFQSLDENAESTSSLARVENTIVMSFIETSWVDIRDQSQEKLAYQSFPAGNRLELSSADTLSILLGNAKGVEMTINGVAYDLSQHTQGVYAKFQIDGTQTP